jgi:hypothetical protein
MRLLRELGGERFFQSEKDPMFKKIMRFCPAILNARLVTLQMEARKNKKWTPLSPRTRFGSTCGPWRGLCAARSSGRLIGSPLAPPTAP